MAEEVSLHLLYLFDAYLKRCGDYAVRFIIPWVLHRLSILQKDQLL